MSKARRTHFKLEPAPVSLREHDHAPRRLCGLLEKRIENGEASTLDLNQVRVSLFSVKQEIQNLTKQRDGGLGSLRSLLGLEPGTGLEILTEQTRPLRLPRDARS